MPEALKSGGTCPLSPSSYVHDSVSLVRCGDTCPLCSQFPCVFEITHWTLLSLKQTFWLQPGCFLMFRHIELYMFPKLIRLPVTNFDARKRIFRFCEARNGYCFSFPASLNEHIFCRSSFFKLPYINYHTVTIVTIVTKLTTH